MIAEVGQANAIIADGDADLVFLARQLLREPYWVLRAQSELGAPVTWPLQYGWTIGRSR